MDNQDKVLFQKALLEAFARKYEHELAECDEDATYSDEHARKMKHILQGGAPVGKGRSSLKARIIVGILVAAAVLLAGCTAYIYRNNIREFIENIYAGHISVTYSTPNEVAEATKIENRCLKARVPDGYELVSRQQFLVSSTCKWQNSENEYLLLEQCVLDGATFMLDIDNGDTTVSLCGEYKIYSRSVNTPTYIWNDGYYSFKLTSSTELSEVDLQNIIDSTKAE